MSRNTWVAVTALLATGMAQATCYSVYKADGKLVHQGPDAPVNLALPIGDTIPAKFGPGATMTMSDPNLYCKSARAGASGEAAMKVEDVLAKTPVGRTANVGVAPAR